MQEIFRDVVVLGFFFVLKKKISRHIYAYTYLSTCLYLLK